MITALVGMHLNNFLGSSVDNVCVLRVCKACHVVIDFSACHTILFTTESGQGSVELRRVDKRFRPSVETHMI